MTSTALHIGAFCGVGQSRVSAGVSEAARQSVSQFRRSLLTRSKGDGPLFNRHITLHQTSGSTIYLAALLFMQGLVRHRFRRVTRCLYCDRLGAEGCGGFRETEQRIEKHRSVQVVDPNTDMGQTLNRDRIVLVLCQGGSRMLIQYRIVGIRFEQHALDKRRTASPWLYTPLQSSR